MVGEGRFFDTLGKDTATVLPGGSASGDIEGVLERDLDGMILRARGDTIPTDAVAGYAIGCVFIHTTGATVAKLFCNIGTTASCNFNQITIVVD